MSTRCAVKTGSGGPGLFAGSARLPSTMKELMMILTLGYCILGVAGDVNPLVGKCCPCGQVISVSENFTCSFAGGHKREIYQFRGHAGHEDFATCSESKNLTLTRLENVVEPTIRANSACIDLMYDEAKDRSVPVIFRCASNGSSEDAAGTGSLAVPRLPTLRMCCAIDQVYDVGKRDCAFKNDGLNVPMNFEFLNGSAEFVTVVRGAPPCKSAVLDYVVNATRDLRVRDGRLEVVLATKDGPETIIANENNTCLDPGTSGTPGLVVIRACSGDNFCNRNSCVRKCCPEDEAMIINRCGKIPSDVPPGYFHNILHNVSVKRGLERDMDALENSDYGMLIGKPCKYGMYPLEVYERWHITPLGYIYMPNYKVYGHQEYCMELFFGNARLKDNIYPVVCFENPASVDDSAIRFGVNAGLELISCFFLIVTLLVYICLPVLRNLHGKTLMCHVSSLIVAYACLATVALGTPPTTGIPGSKGTKFCQFVGFTTLISWIAAFSWLNVMCFDIWWTFGGLGGAATSGGRGRAYTTRFVMYSVYAWGFALIVTCVGVLADTTGFLAFYLRPNIGVNSCWFERNTDLYGEIIFFIGPVSIQLIANMIFFGLTARYCSRVKAEITRVMASPTDPRSRRYEADRTKYIMNIKLFVVMGVSWIFEVISYFLNHYAVGLSWRAEFFYVSDAFNCLQGLLIFILFVLKSKVYYALLRRLGRGTISNTTPAGKDANGLQDPFRVRKSGSNSTIMSNSALSTAPY